MAKTKNRKNKARTSAALPQASLLAQTGVMRLMSALLQLASTAFRNRDGGGSSPIDLREFFTNVTARRELMQRYHEWHGTPEAFDPSAEYNTVQDYEMAEWLADQIDQRVAALLRGDA